MTLSGNLVKNAGIELADLTGFHPTGCTVTRSTTQASSGIASLQCTQTSATVASRVETDRFPCNPGQILQHQIRTYFGAARSFNTGVAFYSSTGTKISDNLPKGGTATAGAWEGTESINVVAPVGTVTACAVITIDAGPAAGELFYLDEFKLRIEDAVLQAGSKFMADNSANYPTSYSVTLQNQTRAGNRLIAIKWFQGGGGNSTVIVPNAFGGSWVNRASTASPNCTFRMEDFLLTANGQGQTVTWTLSSGELNRPGGLFVMEIPAGFNYESQAYDIGGGTSKSVSTCTLHPTQTESLIIGMVGGAYNNNTGASYVTGYGPFGAAYDFRYVTTTNDGLGNMSYTVGDFYIATNSDPPAAAPGPVVETVNWQVASIDKNLIACVYTRPRSMRPKVGWGLQAVA